MHARRLWSAIVGCAAVTGAADAQLLDRLKRKLDETKAEVQGARNEVGAVTEADERIEAAANQSVPTEAQVETRAIAEVEGTTAVQAVREVERDTNAIATADERAVAGAQREIASAEREVDGALDAEGRARGALERTEAAAAAREVQRDANAVRTADDRAELELQRERAELERAATLE